MAGIVSALCVSFLMKFFQKDKSQHALLLELPSYRFPDLKSVGIGLLDRAKIFLKRVGGIILRFLFCSGSCVLSRSHQKGRHCLL